METVENDQAQTRLAQILNTLATFGLENRQIYLCFEVSEGRRKGETCSYIANLAETCANFSAEIDRAAKLLVVSSTEMKPRAQVQNFEGKPLGYVNSEGHFRFTEGTLREIIGWAAATNPDDFSQWLRGIPG